MKGKDYIPNGGIKEFNQAVENHWTFYINMCYDPEGFKSKFPVTDDDLLYFSWRDLIQLFQMASLPDKVLIKELSYGSEVPFYAFRRKFAEFINKEGKI